MKRIFRRLLILVLVLIGLPILAIIGLSGWASYRAASTSEMELSAMRPASGRLVAAGDAQLFVQQAGDAEAPAVVFISGTGGWSGIWLPFMKAVAAQGLHAVALDLPPFGYSVAPASERYDKDSQSRRILAALDSLHIARATFVAHSIGSGAVMQAVLAHPERASGLILIDPALGLDTSVSDGTESLPLRLMKVRWLARAVSASIATNPLVTPAMVKSFVAEKDKVTAAWIDLYRKPLQMPGAYRHIAMWIPELLSGRGDLLSDEPAAYRRINFPTTIIWGRDDTITPLLQGQNLNALIPGSTLVVLAGGHVPMVEEPAAFSAALLRSLSPAKVDDVQPIDAAGLQSDQSALVGN